MSELKFPKKKKAIKKLTAAKVQEIFNAAIRRRDQTCVTPHSPCSGNLECSHFFAKGGNGSLRFYPPNCHAQCSCHHFEYHNRDVLPYVEFMGTVEQLDWMKRARTKTIKYSQELLRTIVKLCLDDNLDELTRLIESKIEEEE